jgi:hypothetical protein
MRKRESLSGQEGESPEEVVDPPAYSEVCLR